MEMNILNNFLLNIPLELGMDFLILWTGFFLLSEKPGWIRGSIALSSMVLVNSIAGVAFFQSGLFNSPFHLGQILSGYLCITMTTMGLRFASECEMKTAVIGGGFAYFIQLSVSLLATIVTPTVMDVSTAKGLLLYFVINLIIFPAIGGAVLLLLRRIQFPKLFQYALRLPKGRNILFLISLVIPLLIYVPIYTVESLKDAIWNVMPFTSCALLFLVLGVSSSVSFAEMGRAKIHEQETVLAQQNLYIKNMENIQKEMRTFRHDYKNMLSGLYLQAQEKNGGELIQAALSKMTDSFDGQIGQYIQQTTQIGNIGVIEVKSLVLAKLTQMQNDGIRCNLEVIYPVESIAMETMELNRCLGILIDNAMEEVKSHESHELDILITQQEDGTVFIVRNPVKAEIDFSKIWKEGYSTKGSNRGLGLYSYQKIVEQEEQLITSAYCSDGVFTQELKVMR